MMDTSKMKTAGIFFFLELSFNWPGSHKPFKVYNISLVSVQWFKINT